MSCVAYLYAFNKLIDFFFNKFHEVNIIPRVFDNASDENSYTKFEQECIRKKKGESYHTMALYYKTMWVGIFVILLFRGFTVCICHV